MIAGLPMYEFASTRAALDALWAAIGERLRGWGVDAPTRLSRDIALPALWRDKGLLLGQTCGYPYVTQLRGEVALLATPIFNFEGCEGPRHCSFLVARRRDARRDIAAFRGAVAAMNSRDSNSGMNLFRAALAPLAGGRPFFARVVVTGAHAQSMEAVAQGRADIAAIDCVSYALIARERPEWAAGLAVIGRTPMSPALPFIASRALSEATRDLAVEALRAAIAVPALAAPLAVLGLRGLARLGDSDYAAIAGMEAQAAAQNYPELA